MGLGGGLLQCCRSRGGRCPLALFAWACRRAQEVFSVWPDGLLGLLDESVQPPDWGAVHWCPATVVWCPVGKGQELLVAIEPDPHLGQVTAIATPVGEPVLQTAGVASA